MKKHSSAIIAFALLLICNGCQKSTDLDYGLFADWYLTTGSAPQKEYTSKGVTVQTDGYFSCTKDTSIQVFFASHPPALGKYHIVAESKASAHTLGPNDVAVEFNVGINDVYLSMDGNDSASIVVTDKGFKHLYIPAIKVVHVYNGSTFDTATASGNISFPENK